MYIQHFYAKQNFGFKILKSYYNTVRLKTLQNFSSFEELVAKGIDFGRLLETQLAKPAEDGSRPPSRAASRQGSITSLSSFMTNENNMTFEDPVEEAEMRSVGNVGGWVYKGYFKAGGDCCTIFTVALLCVLSQFAASYGDFFISEWVKWEEKSVSTRILSMPGIIFTLTWNIGSKIRKIC